MSSTYNLSLPTALDRIRHSLGDTDMAAPLRENETYAALLLTYSETEATAVLAEALAAEYAQQPDSISANGKSLTWKDRVKTWLELATRLRAALSASASAVTSTLRVAQVKRYGDYDYDDSEYYRSTWWSPV